MAFTNNFLLDFGSLLIEFQGVFIVAEVVIYGTSIVERQSVCIVLFAENKPVGFGCQQIIFKAILVVAHFLVYGAYIVQCHSIVAMRFANLLPFKFRHLFENR